MKKESQLKTEFSNNLIEAKTKPINLYESAGTSQYRLHSRRDTSRLLGISPQTLNELIDKGRIKVIIINKQPKIPGTEIQRFLSESLVTPDKLTKSKKVYDIDSFRNGGKGITGSFDTMKIFDKMTKGASNG